MILLFVLYISIYYSLMLNDIMLGFESECYVKKNEAKTPLKLIQSH